MTLEELITAIQERKNCQRIVVAHATHISLFYAAKKAIELKLADFIFVGPKEIMSELKTEAGLSQTTDKVFRLLEAQDEQESSRIAVEMVAKGEGDVLMKGMVSTSLLLKAVLNKEFGLRSGNVLSHLAGFSIPNKENMIFLTDAAMNISPNLQEKVQIVQNAVEAVRKIGINKPKVAVIAAVETVNPAMEATIDAASLTVMNKRNQIKNCVIDGPLGFDNAVSLEAAEQKGIRSEVAGQADIIVAPSIDVGNVLYKSLTIFGNATVGGMIVGARSPIVLTSRADSVESKVFSMAMAVSTSLK
ncbi:bifunctional enoyl-CoA hydratase/phosphate acetyltransferase [Evansella sp. AB-rgal1]|uniref:bifunctional enoyl-CoA hydratase/phosphate acetyltransferase n=1 Tax=Evansella sp. AB-rgal1 TaxID=3242696 RepID=UPI00359E5AE9